MPTKKLPRFLLEILRTEFVIDEPRENVEDAGKSRATKPKDAAGKTEKDFLDILNQISQMMTERERLERAAKEWETQIQKTSSEDFERLFRAAVPLLDSFDRVIQLAQSQTVSAELRNWLNSVAGLQSRVTQLFERFGLRTMDPVGKAVNLDRHEVVEVIHTDSIPDETIVEVRQKGYMFEGKVLRDARVVVAQNERR